MTATITKKIPNLKLQCVCACVRACVRACVCVCVNVREKSSEMVFFLHNPLLPDIVFVC